MGKTEFKTENCIIIVGVGLIGGSIAAAWRKRFPDASVIGVGRCAERLKKAKDADLLTDFTVKLTPDHVSRSCLVVLCLPVDMIADAAHEIADISSSDVVITDAGSVKGSICDEVNQDAKTSQKFVGAHPIAGGENGGFEFADPELFEGRVCVVVQEDGTAPVSEPVRRVTAFWENLGCQIRFMSAIDHDQALALTSHLPHVMAAVTATAVSVENIPLCGSGFRDATRIAAGSASLWKTILAGNRDQVVSAIQTAELVLAEFRSALEDRDDARLELLLAEAAKRRAQVTA